MGCRKRRYMGVVDRHRLGFCVEVENDLFLASGLKLTDFFGRGIEMD